VLAVTVLDRGVIIKETPFSMSSPATRAPKAYHGLPRPRRIGTAMASRVRRSRTPAPQMSTTQSRVNLLGKSEIEVTFA
jgi:hypothetical protein